MKFCEQEIVAEDVGFKTLYSCSIDFGVFASVIDTKINEAFVQTERMQALNKVRDKSRLAFLNARRKDDK